jgi:hypothetical protein
MRSVKLFPITMLVLAALGSGCAQQNSNNGSGGAPNNGTSLPSMSGPNVLSLTVNGPNCSSTSYPNKPCASVTVCQPGTSNCQTINDILVDTGSYGLRVFRSALSIPLAPMTTTGDSALTECVEFGDGSSEWGALAMASVVLGGEPAVQIPIQVLDSTWSNSSTYCSGADTGPSQAGFNGILGVGLFVQDCGEKCASAADNGMYYSCTGSTCTGVAAPLNKQVQNPVTALPQDNNGLILELPSVPLGGVAFANGYLVLGIGTQTNNQPGAGVVAYNADPSTGQFSTSFGGKSYPSFLDSGSNGIFFASASIPDCGSVNGQDFSQWYCPNSTQSLSATNTGTRGSGGAVSFQVGNMVSLASTPNSVFSEIGGVNPSDFDWGMPFYLGRNIYIGIEKASSTLGTGPYWAY